MKEQKLEELAMKYFAENIDQYNNMSQATRLTIYQMEIYDFMDKNVRDKLVKYYKGAKLL